MLEVDIETMEKKLKDLKDAIDIFDQFAEKAFDDEVELLEAMNSDFVSKLSKVLNNMQDNNAVDLVKNLKAYHKAAETIMKELKENQDEAMAKQMG